MSDLAFKLKDKKNEIKSLFEAVEKKNPNALKNIKNSSNPVNHDFDNNWYQTWEQIR